MNDKNLHFFLLHTTFRILNFTTFSSLDTSASLASQEMTIKEHISITSSSHLDYQNNVQNDGEFIATVPKQYHYSGELDADNDIGDDDIHSSSGSSLNRGPYFEATAKNITAIAGQTAYLKCRVRNLGNKTVNMMLFKHSHDLIADDQHERV